MSPTPTKRVAIYARVSTYDKGQDPETQLLPLREYADRRGFECAGEYVDYGTGRTSDRPNYKRLWDDVQKRKVDVVLVFRWSRFARSTQALITALDEFRSLGVDSSASMKDRTPRHHKDGSCSPSWPPSLSLKASL